jgi:hypothetical protein
MTKKIISFLFLMIVLFCPPIFGEQMDLVVLLDTSESMFSYFEDTANYLISGILSDHLKYGDNFHLLSFADTPEVEISKRVEDEKDIEEILGRILLLHPLGKYTDLVAAIQFLYDYTVDLPLQRKKTIIILTDGIHDPPPGSLYPVGEESLERIKNSAALMKQEGWNVNILKFPTLPEEPGQVPSTDSGENGASVLQDLSDSLEVGVNDFSTDDDALSHKATGAPQVTFPGHLGKVGKEFSVPFTITNYRDEPVLIQLEQIIIGTENILIKPVTITIDPEEEKILKGKIRITDDLYGEREIRIQLVFSDDLRIYPTEGTLTFTLRESLFSGNALKIIGIILGISLILFILGYIYNLIRKKMEDVSGGDLRQLSVATTQTYKTPGVVYGVRQKQEEKDKVSIKRKPEHRGEHHKLILSADFEVGKTWAKLPPAEKQPQDEFLPFIHYEQPDFEHEIYRPVEMRVSEQNPHIGSRNIHFLKGGSRTVGGRGSDYLIFITSIPGVIAEIREHGKDCTFIPKNKDFFPELNGQLDNCLGKEIKITAKDKNVTIVFHRWVSPLEKINHVMHLTDLPGDNRWY